MAERAGSAMSDRGSDREARRAQEVMKLIERANKRAARSQKVAEAKQQRQAMLGQFEGRRLH